MGKRAAPQVFVGSTIFNYWQYVTKVEYGMNTKDRYAINHFRYI